MKETAVTFGAAQNLSGVLCEPDTPVPHAPVALMWNVGIHHRVGAFRVWVDVARRLAADGYTSLRFDLSGMGDSDTRRGGGAEDLERREDLEEAMSFLTRRTKAQTFAPIGFCSGIDQLHALGKRDPRVVAMGYIESYVYKTRGYYVRYPLRYLRSTLWKDKLEHLGERKQLRFLKGLLDKKALVVDPGAAEQAAGAAMFARQRPTQQQFAADLESLRSRGVKMLFAYFGLETGFTHAGQFEEMTGIKPGGDVRLFFLGGADHILYRTQDRALTVNEIGEWMKSAFPRPPGV